MDVIESIKARKSIRDYKAAQVPKEMLEKALEVARWAASADNSQPWEVAIIGGKPLSELKRILEEKIGVMEEFKPDIPFPFPTYPQFYTDRCKANGKRLFECLGIPRGDMEKRLHWMKKGIRFFDAPAALILYVDKALGDYAILDAGMFLQNFMLACNKYGLGTCVEMGVIFYPEVLRSMLNIPESKLIICGLAIGYPDENAPVNKFRSLREPIEVFTTWHGFD